MKKFFKNLKAGMVFTGVVSFVLGLVLICLPGVVETALRYFLGGSLCLFGLLEIVFVFVRPNGLLSVGRMLPGILSLAVGFVFLYRFETFFDLIWVLVGIAVLIDAVYKLQYAFELKAGGYGNWWINLLCGFAALVFAMVLIITDAELKFMTVLTGWLLVANSVFDFVTVVFMSLAADRLKGLAVVEIRDAENGGKSTDLQKK